MKRKETDQIYQKMQAELGNPDITRELVYVVANACIDWLADQLIEHRQITIPKLGRLEVRNAPPQRDRPFRYTLRGVFARGLRDKMQEIDMTRKEEDGMVKLGVHTVPTPEEGEKTARPKRCSFCDQQLRMIHGQLQCPMHGTQGLER